MLTNLQKYLWKYLYQHRPYNDKSWKFYPLHFPMTSSWYLCRRPINSRNFLKFFHTKSSVLSCKFLLLFLLADQLIEKVLNIVSLEVNTSITFFLWVKRKTFNCVKTQYSQNQNSTWEMTLGNCFNSPRKNVTCYYDLKFCIRACFLFDTSQKSLHR